MLANGGANYTERRSFERTAPPANKGKILARVWEKQKRGLAHVHGVLPAGSPEEVAWAREYVTALGALAPVKGFGFVDGWHKVGRKLWPGEQAGAYLSSYFVRGRGGKAPITPRTSWMVISRGWSCSWVGI